MPQCFQLFRKGQSTAEPLSKVDAELCAMLGVDVHPVRYVNGWFDRIGFNLACGKSFDEIRASIVADQQNPMYMGGISGSAYLSNMLKCCDYLAANYTANGWTEIGKR